MSTPHDELAYPSVALPQTWPDRLAALAALHGMRPRIDDARVLELGCGDGLNLIAMAVAMPRVQCVGIDLAAGPIARGNALVSRVGVSNVSLREMDVVDVSRDLGTFDYVIAHGLYSWVPPHVRDRVLEICRDNLAPHGVAYVSYNALPGGHLRQMTRRMMMWHTRHVADPKRRVAEGKNLLAFLVRAHAPEHPITGLLRIELARLASLPEGQVFHDDLAPFNDAIAFDEFAAHAARHGLQFLAEADLESVGIEGLPEWVQGELTRAAGGDVIAREMYVDFLRDTAFRQTLLCHPDVQLTRPPAPTNVRGLYLASDARPVSAQPEIHTSKIESFKGPTHANVSTADPLAKAAILALSEAWPRAVRFDELLESARSHARINVDASQADYLGQILLTLCAGGLVRLHARPRAAGTAPGERPLASPLARVQTTNGPTVTTLDGDTIRIDDPAARKLLPLLDGARDRAALRLAVPSLTAIQFDAALAQLGRAGLLVR